LRGVASWRSIKGEMATQKHRLVRAARHLWQRRASRAWQGWVSTVAEQGTLVQLLHRGTSGWTQLQMDDGWSRWMGFGKHRSYIGSVVRRGLSMFNARCLARGLSIWCESTDLLRWSDELRQFALVHMIGAELSRSWRRWLLSIVTQARLLRPQPYLAAKKLPIAWTAWHVHLRSRQNLSMATQHLFRRQLRACYTDWMVATQGSIRILQRLSMAAFTNAALARAWRRWVEMVVQYRVVATWMSRHVASSWRRWVEMASERSRQLQLLRKGVVRLLSLEFARCMTTWREAATIEHACGAALSKAAIVVRRLVHLSLSRGWSSWVSGWCEEVRSCELVRQVHQSLMRQSLARAWRRWSDLALSREDQLRALRRGGIAFAALSQGHGVTDLVELRHIASLTSNSVARALHCWAEGAKAFTVKVQQLQHSAMASDRRNLAQACSAWAVFVSARKRLVGLVRIRHRARNAHYLAEAMGRWSVGSLLVKKTDQMRRHAWLHLQGAQLSRGWQLWLASSVTQAKLLSFQCYVAAKLRLCYLATWREAATSAHARHDALSKAAIVVQRLMHRALRRGWSSWTERGYALRMLVNLVHDGIEARHAHYLAEAMSRWSVGSLLVKKTDKMRRRAWLHLQGAQLSRGWQLWLASSVAQAKLLSFQCCVAAKLRLHAFCTWRHGYYAHRRKRELHRRASRMILSITQAWRAWAKCAHRRTERLAVQCRVVATWMSRHVASSWRRWVEMASERSRQLQLLRKGVVRLLSLEFARCMTTWREAATIEHACGAALSKAAIVVRRLVHLSLSRGWSSWVSGWCEEVRSCELVRQVHQSLMRQSLARAWRRWSDLALSREDQLRALRRGASTLMARRRWRAWVNMACDRSRQQQLLHKGIAFLLSHGLAAWFEATAVAHSHGEALAAAANHFSRRCRTIRRLLCRGWESWLDSWRDTVRTHELRRKVLEYASLKALGAFHSEEVSFPFRFQRRPATTTRTLQNRAVET